MNKGDKSNQLNKILRKLLHHDCSCLKFSITSIQVWTILYSCTILVDFITIKSNEFKLSTKALRGNIKISNQWKNKPLHTSHILYSFFWCRFEKKRIYLHFPKQNQLWDIMKKTVSKSEKKLKTDGVSSTILSWRTHKWFFVPIFLILQK